MQSLLISSLFLIVVTANSISCLPVTLDSTSNSEVTSKMEKPNDRQGRVYNAFGEASASRRGRFNRAVTEISESSTETPETITSESPKPVQQQPNERQGRVYNAFGEASASRRGRFNRDLSELEISSKTAAQVSTVANNQKGSERQGRVYNAFGQASASRRGRFNRNVSETSSVTEIPETTEKTSTVQPARSSERQGRVYNAFGEASASRRGRFN